MKILSGYKEVWPSVSKSITHSIAFSRYWLPQAVTLVSLLCRLICQLSQWRSLGLALAENGPASKCPKVSWMRSSHRFKLDTGWWNLKMLEDAQRSEMCINIMTFLLYPIVDQAIHSLTVSLHNGIQIPSVTDKRCWRTVCDQRLLHLLLQANQ